MQEAVECEKACRCEDVTSSGRERSGDLWRGGRDWGLGDPLAAIVGGPARGAADGRVRLSSNENPLGISPAAKDALVEAIVLSNRYPGGPAPGPRG